MRRRWESDWTEASCAWWHSSTRASTGRKPDTRRHSRNSDDIRYRVGSNEKKVETAGSNQVRGGAREEPVGAASEGQRAEIASARGATGDVRTRTKAVK